MQGLTYQEFITIQLALGANRESVEKYLASSTQSATGNEYWTKRLVEIQAAESKLKEINWYPAETLADRNAELAYNARCAAVLHNLGVSPEDLAILETMISDYHHHDAYKDLDEHIAGAIGEVRDALRENERENAVMMLEAAGFVPTERADFEGLERASMDGVQQVTVEMAHPDKHSSDFWYEFVLEVDGVEKLRGKSGEFGKLLEACGISQNVEAK